MSISWDCKVVFDAINPFGLSNIPGMVLKRHRTLSKLMDTQIVEFSIIL